MRLFDIMINMRNVNKIIVFALWLIMTLALILTMFGCSNVANSQGGVGAQDPISTFPHADGNRWEYDQTLVAGTLETLYSNKVCYFDGTTILDNGREVQNFIITTESGARILAVPGVLSSSNISYRYVDATGVYSYGSLENPLTTASLILPLPLGVGETWERGTGLTKASYEAVATEEITVPAGTFQTIKISWLDDDGSDYGYYEWYADGFGMVKSNLLTYVTSIDGEGHIVAEEAYWIEELASYNF